MKNRITVEDEHLVIRVPLKGERSNPWDEDMHDPMDNVCGLIYYDKHGNCELGFAHWIDMDYKDKPDQVSCLFYISYLEEDAFKKMCEELKLEVMEYPRCVDCGISVMGSSRYKNGGSQCFECEMIENKKPSVE